MRLSRALYRNWKWSCRKPGQQFHMSFQFLLKNILKYSVCAEHCTCHWTALFLRELEHQLQSQLFLNNWEFGTNDYFFQQNQFNVCPQIGTLFQNVFPHLQCHWRLLVSSGLSSSPLGRHQPTPRPPFGESETWEHRTFLLWLRPHWTNGRTSYCDLYKCSNDEPIRGGLTHRELQWVPPWQHSRLSPGWQVRTCCWWDCLGSASWGHSSVSPPERSHPGMEATDVTNTWSDRDAIPDFDLILNFPFKMFLII